VHFCDIMPKMSPTGKCPFGLYRNGLTWRMQMNTYSVAAPVGLVAFLAVSLRASTVTGVESKFIRSLSYVWGMRLSTLSSPSRGQNAKMPDIPYSKQTVYQFGGHQTIFVNRIGCIAEMNHRLISLDAMT